MWSDLAASMGVQHCVCGFLIPPDTSVRVPKCLPGPNSDPRSFPRKKPWLCLYQGGSPLMNISVVCLSSAPLHWDPPNQNRGKERGRGEGSSQKLGQVSSAG